MENNISIERFASMVLDASMKYPKAKVASIGSGRSGDHWYYDITSCVPAVAGKLDEDCWHDSRDLYACIYGWAKEFEREHPNPGFDYMPLVEKFAYEKLKEFFGVEGER